jgi:hypothetical protein
MTWAFRKSRAVHSLLRSNEEGFDNLAQGIAELSRRSMHSLRKEPLGWETVHLAGECGYSFTLEIFHTLCNYIQNH